MKTIILMLLVNLSFEIMVNASTINNVEKGDTLSKRMINGLEVVPIKMKTLIYKGQSEVNLWRLHIPDFEESFQNFESKYRGVWVTRFLRNIGKIGGLERVCLDRSGSSRNKNVSWKMFVSSSAGISYLALCQ